ELIRLPFQALARLHTELRLAPVFHRRKLQFVGHEEVVRANVQCVSQMGEEFHVRTTFASLKLLKQGMGSHPANRIGKASERMAGHQPSTANSAANAPGKIG